MTSPRAPRVRLPERALWIDGSIVRGEAAVLSLFDRGARDGEGLFETLRVNAGVPHLWERHLERLVLSAAELGFPVPASPSRLREGLDALLAASGLKDAAARLTVTRGVPGGRPTRAGAWIDAEPLSGRLWSGTRAGGASAILSLTPFEPGPLGRHKTTSRLAYALATEEARAARVDEALLVSAAGELLEGANSNVFLVGDDGIETPPLARGILPGIARARTLALAAELGLPARERTLAAADVERAREAFVTNSVQEIVPLTRVGAHVFGSRAVGERLREAFRASAD
jgi:branched-subunit amino acid aminotransferase/4-amino-4-deoxychorismate lyase